MTPIKPIYIDGEWGLIEKVTNEWNEPTDCLTDFYTIRHADGTQSKLSSREIRPNLETTRLILSILELLTAFKGWKS